MGEGIECWQFWNWHPVSNVVTITVKVIILITVSFPFNTIVLSDSKYKSVGKTRFVNYQHIVIVLR